MQYVPSLNLNLICNCRNYILSFKNSDLENVTLPDIHFRIFFTEIETTEENKVSKYLNCDYGVIFR